MGKTNHPIKMRLHPDCLGVWQEEIAKGHDIQAISQDYLECDLVVTDPKLGSNKKVMLAEVKMRRKGRKADG